MNIRHITARLVDDRAEISSPDKLFFVSSCKQAHESGFSPIDHLAGALGS